MDASLVPHWNVGSGNYGLTIYASATFGEILISFFLLVLCLLVLIRIFQDALN